MHPISLYFADTQETFSPELRAENEHYKLIAENPVAGAQFFHFIVEMFINMCWEWVRIILDYMAKLLHTMLLLSSKED